MLVINFKKQSCQNQSKIFMNNSEFIFEVDDQNDQQSQQIHLPIQMELQSSHSSNIQSLVNPSLPQQSVKNQEYFYAPACDFQSQSIQQIFQRKLQKQNQQNKSKIQAYEVLKQPSVLIFHEQENGRLKPNRPIEFEENLAHSINQDSEKNKIIVLQHPSTIMIQSQKNKSSSESNRRIKQLLESLEPNCRRVFQTIETLSQYTFIRQKMFCQNYFYPSYKIIDNNSQEIIIKAQKEFCHINSYYSIYISSNQDKKIGFIRGNFGGTQFNLYEIRNGKEELVATILYTIQCSCAPIYRKIQIYIIESFQENSFSSSCASLLPLKQLYSQYQNNKIKKIVTKQPKWNKAIQSYTLNFGGKSRIPSIKNMILVSQDQPQKHCLRFYKTDSNVFNLEIAHSLNIFTAMGILLTSFDFKLLCQ